MTHQGGPAGAEREALASKIIRKMKDKKLTFKAVADKAGLSPFIVTAALHGQMSLPPDAAKKAAKALGMPEAEEFLTEVPLRGLARPGRADRPHDLPILRNRAGLRHDAEGTDP